jgi:hypothetical protein
MPEFNGIAVAATRTLLAGDRVRITVAAAASNPADVLPSRGQAVESSVAIGTTARAPARSPRENARSYDGVASEDVGSGAAAAVGVRASVSMPNRAS